MLMYKVMLETWVEPTARVRDLVWVQRQTLAAAEGQVLWVPSQVGEIQWVGPHDLGNAKRRAGVYVLAQSQCRWWEGWDDVG